MNKIELTGRLVRDVELKTFNSGTSYAEFSIAVPRTRSTAEGKKSDFFGCKVFGKNAENMATWCNKGSLIGVVGRLQVDEYTNRDGEDVKKHYIYVDEVDFLARSNKPDQTSSHSEIVEESTPEKSEPVADLFAEFAKEVDNLELPFDSEVELKQEEFPWAQ